MIELLGVGVPRRDGWLMHRVCARILRGELSVVCSVDPAERLALLDAISGGAVPKEGRVWVSGVPLVSGRVARVRQLVARIDLVAPLVVHRLHHKAERALAHRDSFGNPGSAAVNWAR